MNITALLRKHDQPVPRYTSYPTAVHFNHDISQDTYAGLLSGLTKKISRIPLYSHPVLPCAVPLLWLPYKSGE